MSLIQIDITHWWNTATDAELRRTSGSVAELGEHAGAFTWATAQCVAQNLPPLTDDEADGLRDYFSTFGAWTDEEIAGFSHLTLLAMALQDVAASARTWGLNCATARAEWPGADGQPLTARQEYIANMGGEPRLYVAEWNPDGTPARVTTWLVI